MANIRSGSKKNEDHGIVAVAINRNKNSHFAVKWAVENLLNSQNHRCILVHVQCKSMDPENMNFVAKEGRPPTQEELQQFFLPYRGFCARKGVEAKEVVLHDIGVPNAVADYVLRNCIGSLVVGASHRNAIARKFKPTDVPSVLLKIIPESCAVYVISKDRIQTSRPSSRPQTPTGNSVSSRQVQSPTSNSSTPRKHQTRSINTKLQSNWGIVPYLAPDSPQSEVLSRSVSLGSEGSEVVYFERSADSTPLEFGSKNLSTVTSAGSNSSDVLQRDSSMSDANNREFILDNSELSESISFESNEMSAENLDLSMTSGSSKASNSPKALEFEMRRLKLELQQSMELYNSACKELVNARQTAKEFHRIYTLEGHNIHGEEVTKEIVLPVEEEEKKKEKKKKKEKRENVKPVMEPAQMVQWPLEDQKRKEAEMKAKRLEEERQKSMEFLERHKVQYTKFTVEDIELATNFFAASNKIGEGGYGPVFKGVINDTSVAIKLLRPDLSQGQKQFRKEVEVLSNIRHPNMVLLIGACPEYGCLVYEYMENGSLEDRLFRKDNTPPLPWKTRVRIACEIATGLLFLHEMKPEPLVHRDLKPANILLGRDYMSKIGDVGLARMVPPSKENAVTEYYLTAAAGTFCYIDPEYQQTGLLGVKSDLFSLGVMLLQLVTAKLPMGLSYQMEEAIEKGTFTKMLDPTQPDWPEEEALSLAKMALRCCELRKKDRPDLGSVVLPELNRLEGLAFANKPVAYEIRHSRQKSVLEEQTHSLLEGMRNYPNVEMENST